MNIFSNNSKTKWKKKTTTKPSISPALSLFFLLLFFFILFLISYTQISKTLFSNSPKTLTSKTPQCGIKQTLVSGEKFLWYAPHSGFSNQLSELKNAILMASILNRTLVVPPVLDHHAVVLGSCPKFRVLDPKMLRFQVWNHTMELILNNRYLSMADVVDLSSLVSSSTIKIIDFRVFAMFWCGIDTDLLCFHASERKPSLLDKLEQCGSMLSGIDGNVKGCLYALDEDCRTTVWTYQKDGEDGTLDAFQPDDKLRKKKRVPFVRRRKDVYKVLGPGSEAGSATLLAFGSLFTSPYRGSELYIDIHDAPRDDKIRSLFGKLDSLSFVSEITNAGRDFAVHKIKAPFLCAQLRLLDGQFKNHWASTFLGLKQKLDSLKKDRHLPVHIFLMTDLPEANWTNSDLGELKKDSDTYRLYNLREGDELVVQTAKKIANGKPGMTSPSRPRNLITNKKNCPPAVLPDILLFIEEAICTCASLGFVGTSGSTIAESIELMRKNGVCGDRGQP